jgi:hypothetical protein
LKEFWVYLWNINPNLFALGTTTYPLTKGIYAEIAVIIVLSVAGIASQTKLWKTVNENRQQKAAEQMEDHKARADEEANIGRDIESFNARDREQWEAAHGNKDEIEAVPSDGDSGVGDMGSQKKGPVTTVTSVLHPENDEIEMTQNPQHSLATKMPPTHVSCNNKGAAVNAQEMQSGIPSEIELDADGKSTVDLINRSSYASTKHLSIAGVQTFGESSSEAPTLAESTFEIHVLPAPSSEAPILLASSSEVAKVEESNLEVLNAAGSNSGVVGAAVSDSEVHSMVESYPEDRVKTTLEAEAPPLEEEPLQAAENTDPSPARPPSQMSKKIKSMQSGSIQQDSWFSSSSEPSNGPSSGNPSPRTSQLPLEPQPSEQSLNGNDTRNSASIEASQTSAEPPIEDDLGPLPSSIPSTRRSSYIPFGDSTLMGKRDSILRNKSVCSVNSIGQGSIGSLPLQVPGSVSQRGSSGGESVYNRDYGLPSSTSLLDDNMPLSARRNLLRQPSFPYNPPHPVRRQYSGPSPIAREQQLASFRMGIQRERHSSIVPNVTLERQRSMLWQERQVEGQKQAIEKRRKEEKETAFDQSMRKGDMQHAHREAMRKMQAIANKHV